MRVRVNNYEILDEKININKKIVVLSDIHSSIKYLKKICKYMDKISPDYILIPGDLFDDSYHKDNVILCDILNNIAEKYKVIISIGNHDTRTGKKKKARTVKNESIDYLKNNSKCILLDNENYLDGDFNFFGFNKDFKWYKTEDSVKFMRDLDTYTSKCLKHKYNIVLSHSPNGFINNGYLEQSKCSIDLVVSGHNHGGITPMFIQKISKKRRALVGPNGKYFVKDAYGYYNGKSYGLIISNGVIKISDGALINPFISRVVNKFFKPDIEVLLIKNGKKKVKYIKKVCRRI